MSLLGNLIWFVFGGFLAALGYALGGILLCFTIVGIPFGMQCFRQAGAVLMPFGKDVVAVPAEQSGIAMLFNLIWILLFGWEIALAHLSSALFLALTVVGIPFALQHLKLITIALFPFGYRLEDPLG